MRIFSRRRRPHRESVARKAARDVVEETVNDLEQLPRATLLNREERQIDLVAGPDSVEIARTIEIYRERDGSVHVVVFAYGDHATEIKPVVEGFWK